MSYPSGQDMTHLSFSRFLTFVQKTLKQDSCLLKRLLDQLYKDDRLFLVTKKRHALERLSTDLVRMELFVRHEREFMVPVSRTGFPG